MTTLTEPMMQVPVSLIERVLHSATAPGDRVEADHRAAAELRALLSQPTPAAEPPRIEDLAPGTTFLARHADNWKRFKYVGNGFVQFVGGSGSSFLASGGLLRIDPSTIRDVTPPRRAE